MSLRACRRVSRALLGPALALLLSGCETRTLTIQLADPSRVALMTGTTPVLPPEPGERTATLRDEPFSPEPGARADLSVRAVRAPNGEIGIDWATKVPILNGEHQTLLGADGRFPESEAVFRLMSPEMLGRPTLHIESCLQLDGAHSRSALVGYRVNEWSGCNGGSFVSIPFSLDTPWDNVVEIRDHYEVSRPAMIVMAMFGLGMMAGAGAILFAQDRCKAGCVIGGSALGLLGAFTTYVSILSYISPSFDGPVHRAPAK